MELRLEHLVKDFSGTKAVNDVSITIQDGKLTGLLGPSGCGKSTTLYLISGLESPTSGRIFFGNRDVTALPPEKRGIGLVFQNYALYPHLTVEQNSPSLWSTTRRGRRRSAAAPWRWPDWCRSRISSSASRASSPAASSSGWPLHGRWSSGLISSCWTNPFPIWTPACVGDAGRDSPHPD